MNSESNIIVSSNEPCELGTVGKRKEKNNLFAS